MTPPQYIDNMILVSKVIIFYIDSIEQFLPDNNDKKTSSSFFVKENCENIYPHNYNFLYCHPK